MPPASKKGSRKKAQGFSPAAAFKTYVHSASKTPCCFSSSTSTALLLQALLQQLFYTGSTPAALLPQPSYYRLYSSSSSTQALLQQLFYTGSTQQSSLQAYFLQPQLQQSSLQAYFLQPQLQHCYHSHYRLSHSSTQYDYQRSFSSAPPRSGGFALAKTYAALAAVRSFSSAPCRRQYLTGKHSR